MKYIFGILVAASVPIFAANSASIVPGSLVQGDVKGSMLGNSYALETNALDDWHLDTGLWGGYVTAISITNSNFNSNGYGGNPETIVAFGNGGSVTLKLDNAIGAVDGQKELGLFTAQMLYTVTGDWFNGHMEASVLLSWDGMNWVTLNGVPVTQDYTGSSDPLNAPTMGYDFGSLSTAWSYGKPGTTQSALDVLSVADYTTPMLNDDLFNGNGTSSDRLAMQNNHSTNDYDFIFGTSGGGNWFDISNCGLTEVRYIQLNAVNCDPTMGIRLDAVYTTDAAVLPYCGDASHPVPVGDLNQDCRVNFQDFALFAGFWLKVIVDPDDPANIADLYGDDQVNIEDLGQMAENWLTCTFECD
ncbi:MAG: hypothetical protein ACYTFX_03885 [Planctomycetota bacterium]